MSADGSDRVLKLAVGEPGPQPLHVAVAQQAARVEDAAERQETRGTCSMNKLPANQMLMNQRER